MAAEFKSYKNKLVDFGLRSGSFKNDDGEDVAYEQLVVRYEVDGVVEDLVLSGQSAPKPKLIGQLLRGGKTITEQGIL